MKFVLAFLCQRTLHENLYAYKKQSQFHYNHIYLRLLYNWFPGKNIVGVYLDSTW